MTTLPQHIDNFLNYLNVERNNSPLTIQKYSHQLKDFNEWFSASYPHGSIENLDINTVRQYRAYLAKKNIKRVTQNYYVIALRSFLRFLLKNDVKTLEPSRIDLPKTESRSVKFLDQQELKKLLSMPDIKTTIGLRDRVIFELLFSTGLRVSELSRLNRSDVEKSEINIRGKGNKIRIVFISPDCRSWLEKYLLTRDDTFRPLLIRYTRQENDKEERRLTVRSIQKVVTDYVKQSGISTKATCHTLRHSFATHMLTHGANMRQVQEFLGHANISTTQIYTHITNQELGEVHRRIMGESKT